MAGICSITGRHASGETSRKRALPLRARHLSDCTVRQQPWSCQYHDSTSTKSAQRHPRCAGDCPCALQCRMLWFGSVRIVAMACVPYCDRTIIDGPHPTAGSEQASSQFLVLPTIGNLYLPVEYGWGTHVVQRRRPCIFSFCLLLERDRCSLTRAVTAACLPQPDGIGIGLQPTDLVPPLCRDNLPLPMETHHNRTDARWPTP
jgi:hypothetical protein